MRHIIYIYIYISFRRVGEYPASYVNICHDIRFFSYKKTIPFALLFVPDPESLFSLINYFNNIIF